MRKIVPVIALALGLNACATTRGGEGDIFTRYSQGKRLAEAVELQKQGKISAAMKKLTALCAEQGRAGITDEALFRLSLLSLRSSHENSQQLAQQSLERLRKEYPASPWTAMAAPVTELLRQNRTLRNQNQSLAKESQELRENIEKLKRLDLELERKSK